MKKKKRNLEVSHKQVALVLLKMLVSFWRVFIPGMIVTALIGVLSAVSKVLLADFADISQYGSVEHIIVYTFGLIGIDFIKIYLNTLYWRFRVNGVAYEVRERIIDRFIKQITGYDYAFLSQVASGKLISAMEKTGGIADLLYMGVQNFLLAIFEIGFTSLYLSTTIPEALIVSYAGMFLFLIAYLLAERISMKLRERVSEASAMCMTYQVNVIDNVVQLIVGNRLDSYREAIVRYKQDNYLDPGIAQFKFEVGLFGSLREIFQSSGNRFAMMVACILYFSKQVTTSHFLSFLIMFDTFSYSFWNLADFARLWVSTVSDVQIVVNFLNYQDLDASYYFDSEIPQDLKSLDVVITDMSYTHPKVEYGTKDSNQIVAGQFLGWMRNSKDELQEIEESTESPTKPKIYVDQLVIREGETVAIVGPSGAGKSTLAKIIAGLYFPDSGAVRLSGVLTTTLGRTEILKHVGFLSQEPSVLAAQNIFDNVMYDIDPRDLSEVPQEQIDLVMEALSRAQLSGTFLEQLDDGLDSIIGTDLNISGGERGRLNISRLFIRSVLEDLKMYILDEATAAIDTETEALVMREFYRISEGKTRIIIAHRLSTIMRADRILVMEGGRIVEQGNHQELLESGGLYARMWSHNEI